MSLPPKPPGPAVRARNVVAVLGPTNTGKTHLAIERMLAHPTGVIGLPLRLLAREVYNRVRDRAGADAVALITGEEKILPPAPRYRVCTVEALPPETDASFLAIDEIQLAADLERGHVFTDRLLNLRGRDETLLLGAATMRGIVERLVPGINVVTRPRMSVLAYAGSKKITRLPARTAVVAFSAGEVYAIAELIRRQRGGAAVVLGALSPRTRNAQVELFQSGDVEFLVATDAIGMGLNLDVDHVAFAADRKFDGFQHRRLSAAELGQVAGRAGRHMRDGTFGVTGRAEPFEDPLVEALETHSFDPVKVVQWRNRVLDFDDLDALRASLDVAPTADGLTKALPAEDVRALDAVRRIGEVADRADRPARVALLWDVCGIPDYRRIAPANHAELVATLFTQMTAGGHISEDWFAGQVAYADRTDGDIDTLANRIAHIRTWTFVANQPEWLDNPPEWRERTRAIEDRLSDALHDRLTQRFVDRRTSVLMRRLRENAIMDAEIDPAGDVVVEGQHVGRLEGFRFAPDPSAAGPEGKALRAAAQKALAGEIERRADRLAASGNGDFILSADGLLRWQGDVVARLATGDDMLRPRLLLLSDETLTGPARDRVQARLDQWLANQLETLLAPLFALHAAEGLAPLARGVAFRLVEHLGVVERAEMAEDVKKLDQEMRASLRKLGVRFGAYHVHVPQLLKPAPSRLAATLWALRNGGLDTPGVAEIPQLSASGRTTIPVDPAYPRALYRVAGYKIAGGRAVRIDILERLADLIRPALAWRPGTAVTPPAGAFDGRCFTVTAAMTSLLGCSGEDFASVLRGLGYRAERRPRPPPIPVMADAAPESLSEAAADATAPVEPEAAAPPGEGAATTGPASEEADAEAPEPAALDATEPEVVAEPSTLESAEPEVVAEPEATAEAETIAAPEPATDGPTEERATAGSESPQPVEASAAASAEPADAGPELVEVWRPARFERGPRPAERREARRRATQRERTAQPAAAAPEASAEAGATAGPAGSERGRPGGDRPGPARPGPDRRGRPDRPQGPRRDDRRPRPRDEEPADTRRPRPFAGGRPEPRRERPVDPDSPFAALAALKASLEGRKPE